MVLAGSDERVDALNEALWVYDPDSFLPHGTAKTGFADQQPIYLTTDEENPNKAAILVTVDGMEPQFLDMFTRCLDMFDGASEQAVVDARERWKRYKVAGHTLTYWQQTGSGGWEKKA